MLQSKCNYIFTNIYFFLACLPVILRPRPQYISHISRHHPRRQRAARVRIYSASTTFNWACRVYIFHVSHLLWHRDSVLESNQNDSLLRFWYEHILFKVTVFWVKHQYRVPVSEGGGPFSVTEIPSQKEAILWVRLQYWVPVSEGGGPLGETSILSPDVRRWWSFEWDFNTEFPCQKVAVLWVRLQCWVLLSEGSGPLDETPILSPRVRRWRSFGWDSNTEFPCQKGKSDLSIWNWTQSKVLYVAMKICSNKNRRRRSFGCDSNAESPCKNKCSNI